MHPARASVGSASPVRSRNKCAPCCIPQFSHHGKRGAHLPANAILSQFWFTFQTFLVPHVEEEHGPLAEHHKGLVRVHGPSKVQYHLMFGVLALTADQFLRMAH